MLETRTTFGDHLNDSDSEWDLLLRVTKWLVDSSYAEPSSSITTTITTATTNTAMTTTTTITLDLPLIAIASTGIAIVVVMTFAFYQRTHG